MVPSFVWHRVKPVTKGVRHSLVIWNLAILLDNMIQGGSSKPKGHVDFKSAFYFQTPIWI